MNPSSWLQGALVNGAEATVLALVVWAITRRIRHAGLAHILWCAVLVDLVAPPLIPIPVARVGSRSIEPDPLEAAGKSAPEIDLAGPGLVLAEAAPPVVASWTESLTAHEGHSGAVDAPPVAASWTAADLAARAWIGGCLVFLVFTLARALAFERCLRSARPAPPALEEVVADRARRAGLARPPEVLLVDARLPPLVWALCGRARLILPAELIDRLGAVQVEMLIAHEIAHLARRDHWLRWPEAVLVGLYWWCPAAWWARSGLRGAEEDCCDGHVREAFPGAPLEYAKALMETVDFLSTSRPIPAMASGLGREGRILKRRFDMILDHAPGHRLSRPLRAVLIAALAVLIPLSPGIVAGEDDAKPDGGEGKPDDTVEKRDPEKDPWGAREGAGKEDWARKAPPGDVEARLASLEKQVGDLLAEIKKSRAADTDSDYRKVQNYPVKDELGWKKWEGNSLFSGGRAYIIEENLLAAVDPKTKKNFWVTELPFPDAQVKILVANDMVHVTDGVNTMVLDAKTGKVLKKALRVQNGEPGDKLDPKTTRKFLYKNELPRVSESDDKVRPEKNHLPRVSEKISSIEDLKAEKLKLLERLAELEALETKLEALEKKGYRPAK